MNSGWYNPYLLIPLLSWVVAKFTKFLVRAWRGQADWRLLYASGGMPSAHAAVVTALMATVWLRDGFTSPIFGLSAILALIVIYDALGIRRASGHQAAAINSILKRLDKSPEPELREALGHQPSEVFVGMLLGAVIALLFSWQEWLDQIRFLTRAATTSDQILFVTGLVSLTAIIILIRWRMGHKYFAQVKTIRQLKAAITASNGIALIVGVLLILGQYEGIDILNWRLWPLVLLGTLASAYLAGWVWWGRFIPQRYQNEVALKSARTKSKRRRH